VLCKAEEIVPLFPSTLYDISTTPWGECLGAILDSILFSSGCVADYAFKGIPRNMGGPDKEKLLRLADNNIGIADEPLALLAAMQHFSESAWTM
jgi:hypothetical protein